MSIALRITLGLEVLSAIDLKRQTSLETDEIDDIAIDRFLPAEPPSSKASITQ